MALPYVTVTQAENIATAKAKENSTSDSKIKELAKEEVEGAESGTIENVLGLDSEGNLVKGTVDGGKIYMHNINAYVDYGGNTCDFVLYSSKSTEYTLDEIKTLLKNSGVVIYGTCGTYNNAQNAYGKITCYYEGSFSADAFAVYPFLIVTEDNTITTKNSTKAYKVNTSLANFKLIDIVTEL